MRNNSTDTNQLTLGSDSGQTTVEYGVVLVFVIALAIVAFGALQSSVVPFFNTIAGQLTGVAAGV
jgi:Flp pilus assembly pilin Flp